MKKINNKGFTLIELLAVITIMGILMLVAIPAVSRTIENSRRDTFMDTAKSYMNAIKNAVAADELRCGTDNISAGLTGYYYYTFYNDGSNVSATDLMEQGGKSSWGNANVVGQVYIKKSVTNTASSTKATYEYGIVLIDKAGRGIGVTAASGTNNATLSAVVTESELARTHVATVDGNGRLAFFTKNSTGTYDTVIATTSTKWGTDGSAMTAPTKCSLIA